MRGRRVLVYGVTGSGKTTFARKLSERTGIPWHSVDDLAWLPNWQSTTLEFQRERIGAICLGPEWILDTAYAAWLDIPLANVDLIIALDYPRWLSLSRLARRSVMRLFDRKPICNGNRETLRGLFSRDSIILWHFKSFKRKRARVRAWLSERGRPAVVSFRSPRQAELWLLGLTP